MNGSFTAHCEWPLSPKDQPLPGPSYRRSSRDGPPYYLTAWNSSDHKHADSMCRFRKSSADFQKSIKTLNMNQAGNGTGSGNERWNATSKTRKIQTRENFGGGGGGLTGRESSKRRGNERASQSTRLGSHDGYH